ncbi:MAG: hypothetical protein DSY46_01200 [Hydrogenimonas sp.]|nr:MAG: hypothetical protein DSY46_01200 [Hydrogenimonas sp.]
MRIWVSGLLFLLILTGCFETWKSTTTISFSVLIPKPTKEQRISYVEGVQVITSPHSDSVISAMVVNQPIRSDKEAVIALAIVNQSSQSIPLKWDTISISHSTDTIHMLPVDQIPDYFKQPGHCKPILGRKLFKTKLLQYGVIQEDNRTQTPLFPTEEALAKLYQNIKKDLCYTKIPNDTTLTPHKVTVGYLVIQLSKKNFTHPTHFTLNVPIKERIHQLNYTLQPLD